MFDKLYSVKLGYGTLGILGCTREDRGECKTDFERLRCCVLEEIVAMIFVALGDRISASA